METKSTLSFLWKPLDLFFNESVDFSATAQLLGIGPHVDDSVCQPSFLIAQDLI